MINRQSSIAKVRALLAKTVANGCTAPEAESALLKAREIVGTFNISDLELTALGTIKIDNEAWYANIRASQQQEEIRMKGTTRPRGPRRDSDEEIARDRERNRQASRRDRDDRGSRRDDRGGRGDNRGKVRRSGGSRFQYRERSIDQVRRQAERRTGRFDSPLKKDFDQYFTQDGENQVRILPPTWEEPEHYAYKVWMHRFIGADGSNYLCPRKMLGKPCAICDAERDAKENGEDEEAKALGAKVNWAMWVLDRNADDPERPKVYFISDPADKDIVTRTYNNKRGDSLNVDHPDLGYDLFIRKTGKMLNTRYIYDFDREQTPMLDDQEKMDEVLDFITDNPIPDTFNFYDNNYLETVVSGSVDHSEDEGDDEGDEGDDEGDDRDNDRGSRGGRGGSRRAPLGRRGDPDDDPADDEGGEPEDDEPPFDQDDEGDDPEDDAGPEDEPSDQDDDRGRDRNRGSRDRGRDRDRDRSSSRGGGRDRERGSLRGSSGSRDRGGKPSGKKGGATRRFRD